MKGSSHYDDAKHKRDNRNGPSRTRIGLEKFKSSTDAVHYVFLPCLVFGGAAPGREVPLLGPDGLGFGLEVLDVAGDVLELRFAPMPGPWYGPMTRGMNVPSPSAT